MKNKKFLMIIAVVVISGVLLTAGAMAANPAGSAYEQFKLLLDQEHDQIENATVRMSMEVNDNGEPVIAFNGSMKIDESSKMMSGTFFASSKDESKSFEIYRDNDDILFHLTGSENWYKTTHQEEYQEDEDGSFRQFGRKTRRQFDNARRDKIDENKQLRDALLDTIIGDYKDQITMTGFNGIRTFSLSLDETNMPVLLQTLFQLSDTDDDIERFDGPEDLSFLPQELQDAFGDMKENKFELELVEKKLKNIEISFTVDQQNRLAGMDMSIVCSGTDTKGIAHDLDIDFSMAMSDISTTVIDEANPNPASITTIDSDVFVAAGRRHGMHD